MTPSTNNKQQQFQEQFILAAGYPIDRFVGVEFVWWKNPTNHDSLRLTASGYNWTRKYSKMVYIEVQLSHTVLPKHLLQLERLFNHPYYVRGGKSICVNGETDAIMLQLNAGNLAKYLDNLQSNIL